MISATICLHTGSDTEIQLYACTYVRVLSAKTKKSVLVDVDAMHTKRIRACGDADLSAFGDVAHPL